MLALGQAYTLLHEGGHALAVWLHGGSVTRFDTSLWNLGAHISYTGTFDDAQAAQVHVAGVLLPVLVWAALTGLLPRRVGAAWSWLKTAGTLLVLSSLLPWMVIPLLANRPASDDVTRFLMSSGDPRWLVAIGALLLFMAGWALFAWRVGDPTRLFATWRAATLAPSEHRVRRWAVTMTVCAGVLVSLAMGLAAAIAY